jgi:peptide/nickel transport system substrate-binding protein
MPSPSNRRRAGAVALLLVAVLAGCGGAGGTGTSQSAGSGSPRSDGTFTMSISADPGSLDPQASPLAAVQQIDLFLYDPLIHAQGAGFTSGLAEHWSQKGLTASFDIRPGVTCSDGSPLTASTVAANLDYVAKKKNASPLAGITVPTGSTARASGSVVTLKIPQSDPFLLQGIANLPIVCAKGLAHRSLLAQQADGSGPYVLRSAVAGSRYQLTRRAGYRWGPGGETTATVGLPAKVTVQVVSNETTVANLLLTHALDAGIVSGTDVKRLQAAGLVSHPSESIYGELFYNEASGAATSAATIRRGLTEALDVPALEKVATSGLGTMPTKLTGTSPCTENTVAGNLPAQNVSAAKAALTPLRGKSLKLVYLSKLGPAAAAAAELAVQEWKAAGVHVTATGGTDNQLLQTVYEAGKFDIAWVPIDGQNPYQTYPSFTGPTPAKGGGNFASIANATYDRNAAKAITMQGSASCPMWAAADAALVKDADVVPFADSNYPYWSSSSDTFALNYYGIVPMSIRMRA